VIDRFSMIDRVVQTRVVQRLRAAARDAATSELSVLRQQRGRARQIRTAIDDLLHVAEDRLALPKIGSNVFPKRVGRLAPPRYHPPPWFDRCRAPGDRLCATEYQMRAQYGATR